MLFSRTYSVVLIFWTIVEKCTFAFKHTMRKWVFLRVLKVKVVERVGWHSITKQKERKKKKKKKKRYLDAYIYIYGGETRKDVGAPLWTVRIYAFSFWINKLKKEKKKRVLRESMILYNYLFGFKRIRTYDYERPFMRST
jgi:hypothetical protein